MTTASHSIETSVDESLRALLDEEVGEILAVNFSEQATRGLVEVLTEMFLRLSHRLSFAVDWIDTFLPDIQKLR